MDGEWVVPQERVVHVGPRVCAVACRAHDLGWESDLGCAGSFAARDVSSWSVGYMGKPKGNPTNLIIRPAECDMLFMHHDINANCLVGLLLAPCAWGPTHVNTRQAHPSGMECRLLRTARAAATEGESMGYRHPERLADPAMQPIPC